MDNNYQQNPQNAQDNQPVQPVQSYQAAPQGYQNPQAYQAYQPEEAPGKGMAIASLVMGIISVVFWFFGVTSIVSLVLGIVGIILANKAKKKGNRSGMCTAGMVLSLIGTIVGALILIATISCLGSAACAACATESAYFTYY